MDPGSRSHLKLLLLPLPMLLPMLLPLLLPLPAMMTLLLSLLLSLLFHSLLLLLLLSLFQSPLFWSPPFQLPLSPPLLLLSCQKREREQREGRGGSESACRASSEQGTG